MGYKCKFLDNEVYAAQDVNEMFAYLTSGGVTFSDSGAVTADLNSAVASAVSAGAAGYEACRVVSEDGIYKVSAGVCFMYDGSAIEIDSEGEVITPIAGTASYVYIKRNISQNSIDIVVASSAGGEDSVPLAEIDVSGNISDKRIFARSKVPLGVPRSLRDFSQQIMFTNYATPEYTIDVGADFTHFILWNIDEKYYAYASNLIELADDGNASINVSQIPGAGKIAGYVNVKRNGRNVKIEGHNFNFNAESTVNFAVL